MENSIYRDPNTPTEKRIEDLLGRMTLKEKLAQLVSFWFYELQDGEDLSKEKMQDMLADGLGQVSRVAGSSTLTPVDAAKAGNAIQQFLVKETRLGIPVLLHEECCSGYMGLGGTAFPQMIGLASTWNPPLAETIAKVIRKQLLAIGARQGLAPVLDVSRDVRWGRTEETFGEDPLLAAQFGTAYIKGLQGYNIKDGVIATGKHFVGHSLSDGGLNCGPSRIGPQAIWETFLMPFQAAISEAKVGSMMNAYPELDGDLVAASRSVLTDLLRDKLGFDGIVVSDYEAIFMINFFHKVAPDKRTAAVKALRAGIDIELPTRVCYWEPLQAAVEDGEVSIDEIDLVVRRVLKTKFELGLFENPYVDEGKVATVFETPEQRSLALESARQSMVLLKNDGLLPLAKDIKTIAIIGPNADDERNMLGDYTYAATLELMTSSPMPGSAFIGGIDEEHVDANKVKVPTVREGLQAYLGEGTQVLYAQGCPVKDEDRSGFDQAVEVAKQADVVILVVGDRSGLVPECTSGETRDRTDLGLPGVQEELVRTVAETGKPIVLVMVNGRPYSLPWMDENIPAILEAWLPGEEGAAAIAEILFGDYNPCGKLTVSMPRSVGQIPLYYNHRPSGGRSHWYNDYVEMSPSPLYPFGHGLSYTTFEYSDLSISANKVATGEQVEISLKVKNTGNMDGTEIVQLYFNDEFAGVPRPVKELKGFARVELNAGESRSVRFRLPVDILAFYDNNLDLIVEAGTIKLMVGSSSADINLEGQFEITGPTRT